MRRAWAERCGCLLAAGLLGLLSPGCSSAPKSSPPPESSPKPRLPAPPAAAPTTENAPAPAPAAQPAESPTDVDQVLAYDPHDPLANLEAADALDKLAHAPEGAREQKPPHAGCVVVDAGRRVWPAPGPSAIAAAGRDFVVAGYATRADHEQLFAVRVGPRGAPEPITAFAIEPKLPHARVAPPGLATRNENDLVVAFVDGDGKLWARRLRTGRSGTGPALQIASGIDARFAPVLAASQDKTLLAWTVGSTPMHTHLALLSLEGALLGEHDVTPTGLGAAAPSFVSGAEPPVLLALDPHEGMSPILRIDIGDHGEPQQAQVALPVGMISAPPRIAAASSSIGTFVGYTGLGSAATSAIGLVAIAPIAGTPQALVKGTAYGPLRVAAAAGPRAVVFAADAPTQPGKDPPHEIHVHVVNGSGPGPATVVSAPGGASDAALARSDDGSYGLAFTAKAGVYVARLRCDDGG
jgi:hypothetical protein